MSFCGLIYELPFGQTLDRYDKLSAWNEEITEEIIFWRFFTDYTMLKSDMNARFLMILNERFLIMCEIQLRQQINFGGTGIGECMLYLETDIHLDSGTV